MFYLTFGALVSSSLPSPFDAFCFNIISGITLDERVYHSPHEFRPERFLPEPEGSAEPLPLAAFGYGRRFVLETPFPFMHLRMLSYPSESALVDILH